MINKSVLISLAIYGIWIWANKLYFNHRNILFYSLAFVFFFCCFSCLSRWCPTLNGVLFMFSHVLHTRARCDICWRCKLMLPDNDQQMIIKFSFGSINILLNWIETGGIYGWCVASGYLIWFCDACKQTYHKYKLRLGPLKGFRFFFSYQYLSVYKCYMHRSAVGRSG